MFWLADHIHLLFITPSHYHHWKLIGRHWNYKMPVRYVLSSVWVRLSIFSQLSIIQYMGCVFSVYPLPLWWLKEYILSLIIIIKSDVWTIIHCLGLGHKTMVCAVCLYILMMTMCHWNTSCIIGSHLNITTVFLNRGISIIKIRLSWGSFIFIMGFPILVSWHLYIDPVLLWLCTDLIGIRMILELPVTG